MNNKYLGNIEELKRVYDSIEAFSLGTGIVEPFEHMKKVYFSILPYISRDKKCLLCGRKNFRDSSMYCSYGCAEEDGAIEK